jgi:hypothetical protein
LSEGICFRLKVSHRRVCHPANRPRFPVFLGIHAARFNFMILPSVIRAISGVGQGGEEGTQAMAGDGVEVLVIGAGLAGLRCAGVLSSAGRDVCVWEQDDDVGGRVRTNAFDGFCAIAASRF